MKKLNLIIVGIGLVMLVSAGAVLINLEDATFTPANITEQERYIGNVTFDCGKEEMSIYLDEPNMDIDDDFEDAVKGMCNINVTNIIDWYNRTYQQNDFGLRSFDEDKLKADACGNSNGSWINESCLEIPEEPGLNITEPEL